MTGAPPLLPPTFGQTRQTGAFERLVGTALHRVLPTDAPLVVGCSGGPDSSALLIALARVHRGPLTAACFNHRMRPEAEAAADHAFVLALAGHLGIACVAGAAAPSETAAGAGPEASARAARYRWLARVAADRAAGHVAVGHTLDDQAETVLLRLTRGSGQGGAGGMRSDAPWPLPPPESDADAPPLRLLRPMLDLRRQTVHDYVEAVGVTARDDPSNALLGFDRNRVRNRVLPELRHINPAAAEALARFARRAAADDAALDAIAAAALAATEVEPDSAGGSIALDRRALADLDEPIASRVIRLAAARLGLTPTAAQITQALGSIDRGGAETALASGHIRATGAIVQISRHE